MEWFHRDFKATYTILGFAWRKSKFSIKPRAWITHMHGMQEMETEGWSFESDSISDIPNAAAMYI